ncbi:MAG: peptidase [Actinomycetota bacterium]
MRLLVAAALIAAAVGVPAAAVAAAETGIGIRLLEAPTDRRDDPRARSYIIDHLAPGSTIERRIEVSNGTAEAAGVEVYAGAAELEDGQFQPLPQSETNDLVTWTEVEPSRLGLPPGQSAPATVTIAVPDDASPGERYGAVWAQVSSDPDAGGVTQVNRVGIRIYLSVGSGGEPASDFEITSLTASRNSDGIPVVTAEVENTGGRALDLTGELSLTDGPGGLSGGPFPATLGTTLAVGAAESVRIVLDEQLPDGPWQAVLTLESGLLQRSVSAEITFPDSGEANSPVEVTSADTTDPRLVLAGAAVLLLLVGLILVWRSRRRNSKR